MKWIIAKFKWIMLVTGVLTASMFYYAIAPNAALRADFGQGRKGPLAELIVRNWGVLVGLVGVMLVYGAFVPPARGMRPARSRGPRLSAEPVRNYDVWRAGPAHFCADAVPSANPTRCGVSCGPEASSSDWSPCC